MVELPGVLDERIDRVRALVGAAGDPQRGSPEDRGRRQAYRAAPGAGLYVGERAGLAGLGGVEPVVRRLEAGSGLAVQLATVDRLVVWPSVHLLAGSPADGSDHRARGAVGRLRRLDDHIGYDIGEEAQVGAGVGGTVGGVALGARG